MKNKTVLVIVAHPDDETACGGTIAKLSQGNNQVIQVVATNGDKGTHDVNVKPSEITNMRKKEMKDAAEVLGINRVIWLGFEDGTLEQNMSSVKEKVFKVVRKVKPDIVISFDPWKRWDPHSDHRTIGFIAVEAAYLADGVWYYPEHKMEGLEPHDVSETYLFHTDEPNYTVDVKETFHIKKEAADAHKSQSLSFTSFGEKYLERLKQMVEKEEEIYKEKFRKLNQSDLYM
ncbi:PIG-L deacetylase family protein [Evansella halocellulosilytica]|uniref:PIG-L deacetylase family protein n=1 Tax=Evansella halocellulosilytica TaxID=2011013 RepID=UPI000BB67A3E|nr:PIG-L deacetylase family protein [Evansella halocellulosilytica]